MELDLSHNKIASLGSNLNTKLGNIKKLNLAGNELDSVQGTKLGGGHCARVRYKLGTNVDTIFFLVLKPEFGNSLGARVRGRDLLLGH